MAVRVLRDGRSICTGALVGAAAVLTARHCLQEGGAFAVSFPWEERVSVASIDRALGDDSIGDVAVLRLSRAPSRTIEPLVIRRAPVTVGARVSLLRAGAERVAAKVTARDPGIVYTTPASCDGDSGAPLLLDGAIVAVASSRASGACGDGPSVFTELRAQNDWLEQVLDLK